MIVRKSDSVWTLAKHVPRLDWPTVQLHGIGLVHPVQGDVMLGRQKGQGFTMKSVNSNGTPTHLSRECAQDKETLDQSNLTDGVWRCR